MAGSSPQTKDTTTEAKADVVETAPDVATSADSSPAETKGEVKGDMLSAVKAALKPDTEKAPDSGEQGSKSETDPAASAKEGEAAGEESDDLNEEELARLRPKTRKRIDNLLKDRSDRDAKIADLEPKAQQFETMTRFVESAGLSRDEVNQGFDVMRSLKHEPLRAYQVLRPIMDQLEQIVGVVLPQDLQQEVVQGRITQDRAQELARTRAASTLNQRQLEDRERGDKERRDQEAHQGRVADVSTKVSEWERSQEKSDPDWKIKQPRVLALVKLEIQDRKLRDPSYFPTVEQALGFAKDALKTVTDEIKAFAPARREIKPGHIDAAASSTTPKPKTMLEAARMAMTATG